LTIKILYAKFRSMTPEAGTQEVPLVERYTLSTEARKLLELSRVEVVELNHTTIGTEHLLLACLKDPEIAQLLTDQLKLNTAQIEEATKFIVSRNQDGTTPAEIGFTPRIGFVLSKADSQRRKEKAKEITTLHLLIGLVQEGNGIAASVLESLGLNYEKLIDHYNEDMLRAHKEQLSRFFADRRIPTAHKYYFLSEISDLADRAREIQANIEPKTSRPQQNALL